jgi:signal transduction histidine kinase
VLGVVLREAPAQAIPACVEGTARLFGAERACLYSARPDESLVVLHNVGLSERYIAAVLREHPRGPGGIAARLSGPLFIEDAFDDARTEVLREDVRAEDIRSMLFIPIRWAGGLVGGLALYFTQKRHLTAVELEQAAGLGLWMGPVLRAVQQQQLIEDIPGGLLFQGSRGWVPLNARGARALPSLAATPARQTQMSTSPPLLLEGPHHGAPLSLAVEAPRPASEDPARHQIAYLASHALRDPLTAIKGYLGLAVERLRRVGQQPIAQAVERILGPAERVAQVADALLSFAHLDAGQQMLARAPLDLVALLREVVAELSGEQTPIALQASGSFLLRGDIERLRPALRCLLRCGSQVYEREGLRVVFSAGPEPTIQLGPAMPRGAGALLSLRNGLGLEGHLALYLLSLHGVKGDLPLHPGAPLCLSLPVSEGQAQ